MNGKQLLLFLSLAGAAGKSYRSGLNASQVADLTTTRTELTKINWGKPGFCTEFAADYESNVGRCRSGASPYRRKILLPKTELGRD